MSIGQIIKMAVDIVIFSKKNFYDKYKAFEKKQQTRRTTILRYIEQFESKSDDELHKIECEEKARIALKYDEMSDKIRMFAAYPDDGHKKLQEIQLKHDRELKENAKLYAINHIMKERECK